MSAQLASRPFFAPGATSQIHGIHTQTEPEKTSQPDLVHIKLAPTGP